MIDFIKGKLIHKSPARIVIESNGTGYEIMTTLSAYEILPDFDNEVTIITHLHIKENPFAFVLYGFSDNDERECFRNIISVSGIGPKTALSVLSGIGYKEFINIILNGNIEMLTSISGIGKKTAERMRVELKDKLSKSADKFGSELIPASGEEDKNKVAEVMNALISLGYSKSDAEFQIKKSYKAKYWDDVSIENIIKNILMGK